MMVTTTHQHKSRILINVIASILVALATILAVRRSTGFQAGLFTAPTSFKQTPESVSRCHHATDFPSNCLPLFYIGGAMKCGTNEAMRLIALHPRMKFNLCPPDLPREQCTRTKYQGITRKKDNSVSIWEAEPSSLRNWDRNDVQNFLDRLPETDGINTFNADKSPSFLTVSQTLAPALKRLMPNIKMIFTLCDPTERTISEYFHLHRSEALQSEFERTFTEEYGLAPPTSLSEFLQIITKTSERCEEEPHACDHASGAWIEKSLYQRMLSPWYRVLDRSDILILDMTDPPEKNVIRMLEFLELPADEYPWGEENSGEKAFTNTMVPGYTSRTEAWAENPNEMKKLASMLSSSIQELVQLVGADFPLRWKTAQY